MERDVLKQKLREVDRTLGKGCVRIQDFNKCTGIHISAVLKHYDSWVDFCKDAGVAPGKPRLKVNQRISKEACTTELLRISELITPQPLTLKTFQQHAREISLTPIRNHWGSLSKAIAELGLAGSTHPHESVPVESLAKAFLAAAIELGRRSWRTFGRMTVPGPKFSGRLPVVRLSACGHTGSVASAHELRRLWVLRLCAFA